MMDWYLLLILALCFRGTGCAPGAVFLWIALQVLLTSAGVQLETQTQILLLMLFAAAPLAARLAAALIESFMEIETGRRFQIIATLLTFTLLLKSDALYQGCMAAKGISAQPGAVACLGFIAGLGSAVVFVAGLLGFILMGGVLLIELPFLWWSRVAGVPEAVDLRAVRPLGCVLLAALGVNLAVDLFAGELNPVRLLHLLV